MKMCCGNTLALYFLSLSAIIVFQDGGTTWKPPWTNPSLVNKDNKFLVYKDKGTTFVHLRGHIFMN